jgi:ribosome-associated protein
VLCYECAHAPQQRAMTDPLYVNEQIEIPGAELVVRTSRSTGAGGQHANVTDSRVEVSFDIAGSSSLPEWARSRLLERLGPRVTAVAQDERSQLRNRELARSRLAERLRAALEHSRSRRPTRPGPAARERRLDSKRRQSRRKQQRRPPPEE